MLEIDKSWSLFLDRDGVINQRIKNGYVKSSEEFIFLPGVLSTIEAASRQFGRIFVVTNQQGIGKKLMTEKELKYVHEYMSKTIKKNGGHVDHIYYAPQLDSENSEMRKPKTGMAHKAKKDYPDIDFSRSIMVGDSSSDIEFGNNSGMKTVLIQNEEINFHKNADYSIPDLQSLFQIIN